MLITVGEKVFLDSFLSRSRAVSVLIVNTAFSVDVFLPNAVNESVAGCVGADAKFTGDE